MISLRPSVFLEKFREFSLFSFHSNPPLFLLLFLLVFYLAQFFSMLVFLVFTVVSLLLIRKFHQTQPPDTLPVVSFFQMTGAFFKILRNIASARILFMELMVGIMTWFAKEGTVLFRMSSWNFLFLYNPNTVEPVLKSSTLLKKGFPYGMLQAFLKEGLLTSEGSKWRLRRKLLTPAFHFKILDGFIHVFDKQSNRLVKKIDELMQKQDSIDIVPQASLWAINTILETVMGMDAAQVRGKEFSEALHRCALCLCNRVPFPWLWFDSIFLRTKEGKTSLRCLDTLEKIANGIIKEKLRERSERPMDVTEPGFPPSCNDIGRKTGRQLALLDLLVDLHLQDGSISLQDIAEEVNTFLAAGNDTLTVALSWALYLLGLYRDVQRKAQEEVDIVLGDDVDRTITIQDIRELKYLHCVLKETLRLYPAAPFITRIANEDTTICGHKIKKGTTIIISIFNLHRNSESFPNPEQFNPERFSPENVKNRHPFAYVPFSAGSRNCIGQRFATHKLITALATVLRHFSITSIEHIDKIKYGIFLVLIPENGLHLKFTRRQFTRNYTN